MGGLPLLSASSSAVFELSAPMPPRQLSVNAEREGPPGTTEAGDATPQSDRSAQRLYGTFPGGHNSRDGISGHGHG